MWKKLRAAVRSPTGSSVSSERAAVEASELQGTEDPDLRSATKSSNGNSRHSSINSSATSEKLRASLHEDRISTSASEFNVSVQDWIDTDCDLVKAVTAAFAKRGNRLKIQSVTSATGGELDISSSVTGDDFPVHVKVAAQVDGDARSDDAARAAAPECAVLAPAALEPNCGALPDGWEELLDGGSLVKYYHNVATGKTQWEHPCAELEALEEGFEALPGIPDHVDGELSHRSAAKVRPIVSHLEQQSPSRTGALQWPETLGQPAPQSLGGGALPRPMSGSWRRGRVSTLPPPAFTRGRKSEEALLVDMLKPLDSASTTQPTSSDWASKPCWLLEEPSKPAVAAVPAPEMRDQAKQHRLRSRSGNQTMAEHFGGPLYLRGRDLAESDSCYRAECSELGELAYLHQASGIRVGGRAVDLVPPTLPISEVIVLFKYCGAATFRHVSDAILDGLPEAIDFLQENSAVNAEADSLPASVHEPAQLGSQDPCRRAAYCLPILVPAKWCQRAGARVEVPCVPAALGDMRANLERRLQGELCEREATGGVSDPSAVDSLRSMARCLASQARHEDAAPLWRSVVRCDEEALGMQHHQTLASMEGLATCLLAKGDMRDAEVLLSRVVMAKEKAHGKHHPSTLKSVAALAGCLRAQGLMGVACELYGRAAAGGRTRSSEKEPLTRPTLVSLQGILKERPETLAAASSLAGCLRDMGRVPEAEVLLRSLLQTAGDSFGDGHADTVRASRGLASVLSSSGNAMEAESLYRRAIRGGAALGPGHPESIAATNEFAVFLKAQGRPVEARLLHEMGAASAVF